MEKHIKIVSFKYVSLSNHKYRHQKVVYPYTTGETPDLPSFLFFFFKKMEKRNLKQGSIAQKHYTRFHQTIFSPE